MVMPAISELIETLTPPSLRLVTARIVAATPDSAQVQFLDVTGKTRTGTLPVTGWTRRAQWQVGDEAVVAVENRPGQAVVTMTAPTFPALVVEGCVPEVRDGAVRVMGVARRPGTRTKVAVAATVEGLDPVAACIGRGHGRVDDICRLLGGEQVDIVAWHPDRATYLANALQPAKVVTVQIDEETQAAVAVVPEHQMASAVGGGGLNSVLAGQLVGLTVRVASAGK